MHRPKYITIDRQDMTLDFAQSRRSGAFSIPTQLDDKFRPLSPLEQVVYHEILYRAVHAEDRRKGKMAAYKLVEPEPWMIAFAFIMWEGIIQGLAWDMVKLLVQSALASLREKRLAPPQKKRKRHRSDPRHEEMKTETELGFAWHKYAEDGRKLHHMFVGLRRVHSKQSARERDTVSSSAVQDRKKPKGQGKSRKG